MEGNKYSSEEVTKYYSVIFDDYSEDNLFPKMKCQNFRDLCCQIQHKKNQSYNINTEAIVMERDQEISNKEENHPNTPQNQYEDQENQMKRIKKIGKKEKKLTSCTKKLNNAHKYDYRHFIEYFQANADKIYLDQRLKAKAKEIIDNIGSRKATTMEIASLFANKDSKQGIQMSYLNCQLMKNMFQQQAASLIFENNKLANKKTFYLHIVNKHMRLQKMHLSSRLQAR